MIKITLLLSAALICLSDGVREARTQPSPDADANVRRAAQCLRQVPGLIEGKSQDDLIKDNAHWVLLQEDRGRIGFPRTFIRFHKGVREGMFTSLDTARVMNCISGLQQLPSPQ